MQNQNQEIIYTHRTRDGRAARIITKINNSNYPIVAAILNENGNEYCETYTEDLKSLNHGIESEDDLLEYNSWQDVLVDTPIFVRRANSTIWYKRHFAKYENGKVFAWIDGCTSWSSDRDPVAYEIAKLPDKE